MDTSRPQHAVLFPLLAQGHITPFLALAQLLARRRPNLIVTVVSTPLNIRNISSTFPPPSLSSSIQLRSLPFSPEAHGLPPGAEIAGALPFHQIVSLFHATKSFRPAFEQLIAELAKEEGHLPICIVADPYFMWTIDVARQFRAFHSIFITSGAYGTVVYSSLWMHLPHRQTDADEFPLSDFPDIFIHRSQLPKHMLAADGNDPWAAFIQGELSRWLETDAILVNTVEEVERTGLRMMRKVLPCSIWPIGPLLSSVSSPLSGDKPMMEWLDSQPSSSVLYISFGSQNTITASQMVELAMGLEASGVQFVWVIRPPVGCDVKADFKAEWLPEKFEERMREQGRGILVQGWAPQLDILAHTATGAFLSHCGWNSVLESLSSSVPILAWPLSSDQLYNAGMLEEMGVSMEVARGNLESSKTDRAVVEGGVREVMGGGERGKEMRRRAKEVRLLMEAAWREGIGSSVRGLEEFFREANSINEEEREQRKLSTPFTLTFA